MLVRPWVAEPRRMASGSIAVDDHEGQLIHSPKPHRYACNKPAPKLQGDLQAWRAALNNLRAQQEHQGNRCVGSCVLCRAERRGGGR